MHTLILGAKIHDKAVNCLAYLENNRKDIFEGKSEDKTTLADTKKEFLHNQSYISIILDLM